MASCMPFSIISIEFMKYAHYSLGIKENVKRNVPDTCTWSDVFKMHHDQQGKEIEFVLVHWEPGHTDIYTVLTVEEVHNFSLFGHFH